MSTKSDVAKLVAAGKGAKVAKIPAQTSGTAKNAPVMNALQQSIESQVKANAYTNAPSLSNAQAPTAAQVQAISSGNPQAVQEATQQAAQAPQDDPQETVYAQEAPPESVYAPAAVSAAAEVAAPVLPAKPVFNPSGDKSWNGATGLSDEAVAWLNAGADSTYFDDVNASQKTFDGFSNDINTQRANAQTDRMAALRRLGYNYNETSKTGSWNDEDMTTARGGAISDMGYDYGARGLLHSSEYARRLTDAQNQYQDQANAIVSAGDRFNTSLTAQSSNAQAELADAKLAAIRQAVQRKAAAEGTLS